MRSPPISSHAPPFISRPHEPGMISRIETSGGTALRTTRVPEACLVTRRDPVRNAALRRPAGAARSVRAQAHATANVGLLRSAGAALA